MSAALTTMSNLQKLKYGIAIDVSFVYYCGIIMHGTFLYSLTTNNIGEEGAVAMSAAMKTTTNLHHLM